LGVAVVTDSTSDIDPALAEKHGITVVPLFVIWGERRYRDYVELSREEFYRKLEQEPLLPATSQPTLEMFASVFAAHAAAGTPIYCIVVSSKLSGTVNVAHAAAQQFPGARIVVRDSRSVAGGLAMLALRAAACAKSGATLEAIDAAVERMLGNLRLFGCLPDLSFLVRTGRIGRARAAVGTLMKIVPVLTLKDGEVVAEAQVRTFSRAREVMIELTMRGVRDPENTDFLVMHTHAPELAAEVAERVGEALLGKTPASLEIREAGPVIATHGGPGAVGIFSC